jgi:hypothetical protein
MWLYRDLRGAIGHCGCAHGLLLGRLRTFAALVLYHYHRTHLLIMSGAHALLMSPHRRVIYRPQVRAALPSNMGPQRRSARLDARKIRDNSDLYPLEHVSDRVVVDRDGTQVKEPRVFISDTARAHWDEGDRLGFAFSNISRIRLDDLRSVPPEALLLYQVALKMSTFVINGLGALLPVFIIYLPC